jgi:RimJ/RimL family protein N-acetyltransferase
MVLAIDLASRFHDLYCMYRYAEAGPLPLDPPAVDGLAWQFADVPTVRTTFSKSPRLRHSFEGFLRSQAIGVFLTVEDDWACHLWMSTPGPARPPHIKPGTAANAFWFFYGATRPGWGGRGLFRFAQRLLIAKAFESEPAPEILADPQVGNHLSRRAHLGSGFIEAGMLRCNYLWVPRLVRVPLASHWDRRAAHPPLMRPDGSPVLAGSGK